MTEEEFMNMGWLSLAELFNATMDFIGQVCYDNLIPNIEISDLSRCWYHYDCTPRYFYRMMTGQCSLQAALDFDEATFVVDLFNEMCKLADKYIPSSN